MASNSDRAVPSLEIRQSTFEAGVALALHLWPDLTFAIENGMGGPDGADKRDWFGGAVVELFPAIGETAAPGNKDKNETKTKTKAAAAPQAPAPDSDDLLMDVESRLLQVMSDEFDVDVDDGSAFDLAEQIVLMWKQCGRGVFTEVDGLRRRWEAGKGRKVSALFKEGQAEDQDTDWDTEDDDDDDDDGDGSDVEMGDAPPALVSALPKEKPPPEVDEDGFTKVTKKKR